MKHRFSDQMHEHMVLPWLLALTILHVAAYPFASGLIDTTRDISQAMQIVTGTEFPLRGPAIYGVTHTSPLWFYLLAPVLALSKSQAAAALFTGLLTALKFPAAFMLGRELGGRRLGLLLAMAIALPGWSIVQWLVLTQANLVEAMVLFHLWALLRCWRTGEQGYLALAGLFYGLALSAHPTVLFLLPLTIVVWVRELGLRRATIAYSAAAFVLACLPFVPVMIAEAREGWPAIELAASYVGGRAGSFEWQRWFDLLRGAAVGGFSFTADYLAGPAARKPLWLIYCLLSALAALGIIKALVGGTHRAALLIALTAALILPALLIITRPNVPAYMIAVWQPFFAGLFAIGWNQMLRQHYLRTALFALLLGISALNSAVFIGRAQAGYATIPAAQISIVEAHQRVGTPVALLPTYAADAMADAACATNRPQIFHADLAMLLDTQVLRSFRLRCPSADVRIVGGANVIDADHWVGLNSARMRDVLGLGTDAELGGWALRRVTRVVHPQRSLQVPDGLDYPARALGVRDRHALQVEFRAPAQQIVMLSNPLRLYAGPDQLQVLANGVPVEGLYLTDFTSGYRHAAIEGQDWIDWQIQINTGAPEAAEVLLFDPCGYETPGGRPCAE